MYDTYIECTPHSIDWFFSDSLMFEGELRDCIMQSTVSYIEGKLRFRVGVGWLLSAERSTE